MRDDDIYESEEERRAAEERIRRIRGEGEPPPSSPLPSSRAFDDSLDAESEAAERVRARARAARAALEPEPSPRARPASRRVSAGGGRSQQGLLIIGGLVLIGIVIVVVLLLVSMLGGGTLPFGATATPTSTPTPTETPTPIATETPTPTRPAPNLALPPLTCIFQSGVGCFEYCQSPDNAAECNSAKAFVRAQNADPDLWLSCIAPGPGPNVGNPQACLEDAWRSLNP